MPIIKRVPEFEGNGITFIIKNVRVKFASVFQPNTTYRPEWAVVIILPPSMREQFYEAGFRLKTDQDGDVTVRAKRYCRLDNGEEMNLPEVVDADMNPWNPQMRGLIGNGSRCNVKVKAKYTSYRGVEGCSLYLNGLQVLDHVPYAGGGPQFSQEQGSTAGGEPGFSQSNPNQGHDQWGGNPNQGHDQWGGNPNQGRDQWGGNPNQGRDQWDGNPNQGRDQWGGNPNQGRDQWDGNPNQGRDQWGGGQGGGNPNQGGGQNQGGDDWKPGGQGGSGSDWSPPNPTGRGNVSEPDDSYRGDSGYSNHSVGDDVPF